MTNEKFVYNDGRIWAAWQVPDSQVWSYTEYGGYKKYVEIYNTRPNYPVHPDLQKIWVNGQKVVKGIDFGIFYDGYIDSKDYSKAVPLPAVEGKPDEVKAMQEKFAAHLGLKPGQELNTTDAYAIEWAVNNNLK